MSKEKREEILAAIRENTETIRKIEREWEVEVLKKSIKNPNPEIVKLYFGEEK